METYYFDVRKGHYYQIIVTLQTAIPIILYYFRVLSTKYAVLLFHNQMWIYEIKSKRIRK